METVKGSNALDAMRWQQEDYKAKKEDNGMLTQEDFFALLTKELSYQDPTKPVENNEMISQMTAFSTTDGVSKLNESFDSFAASMSSGQALQASSLVGRSVLVDDEVFGMAEGQQVKGKLVTDTPTRDVKIFVQNAAGEVVQTVPVGDVNKGEFGFVWNGQMADGNPAPTGIYKFKIKGLVPEVDAKTGNVLYQGAELQAMTYRKVDSVTLSGAGGSIFLNLNGGSTMKLSEVKEVSEV
ncbi:flagellar hook assembly protein FlgD [Thalassotalea marina]|uniref:Basal-body rod modification protein FlgD n=1 Tax=Thalassotalea marina TaxID=1673741 RepID=A0A919BCW1_9GAMM|nr:flagellar hook assembly protein FlgD [Thalassotalea marina]GHF80207.1 basal-body rod modification protein FlgD [Thalassotalea marina]